MHCWCCLLCTCIALVLSMLLIGRCCKVVLNLRAFPAQLTRNAAQPAPTLRRARNHERCAQHRLPRLHHHKAGE